MKLLSTLVALLVAAVTSLIAYASKSISSVVSVLTIAFASLYATVATAALPLVVGTTITDIQTDALALVDLVWPVVGVVTGAFILFKIFKRGTGKI